MTKLELMVGMVSDGRSIKEAMAQVVPNVDYKEVQAKVSAAQAAADRLKVKYTGGAVVDMIYSEIQKEFPDDIPSQFRKLAAIKHDLSVWNLNNSEGELRAQQMNVAFMREAYEKTYEEELSMADTASAEELNALKNELGELLPEDLSKLHDMMKVNASPEVVSLMNDLQADPEFTEIIQTQVAMLATAAIMDDGEVSDADTAAKMGYAYAAVSVGNKKSFLASAAMALGTGTAATAFAGVCANLAGYSALSVGLFKVTVGLSLGFGAAVALYASLKVGKKMWPVIKPAYQKVIGAWDKHAAPVVREIAARAKHAVKQIYGFAVNKVFHPVIEWTQNTAIPFILNQVYHPMERRLKQLWAWLVEKKDQFVEFFCKAKNIADEKAAAHAASADRKEAVRAREELIFDEDDDENEHAYAY